MDMSEFDEHEVVVTGEATSNNIWGDLDDEMHKEATTKEGSGVERTHSLVLPENALKSGGLNATDLTDSIGDQFVSRIGRLPHVSSIYEHREPNQWKTEFWVVVDKNDFELRNKIYSVEYDLMSVFKNTDVDSHVLFVGDGPIEDRIPEKAWEVSYTHAKDTSYATGI